ncbi:MAG: redoxin family protein [Planctomycetes bacterium]|nr:redoxin family protein [Planctomycetota bacterium]
MAQAAAPSAAQALKLRPVQDDVEYTTPTAAEIAKCTIKAEKFGKATGWVVRDEAGSILRRFLDTNVNNVVDQWCYYHNGLEVYRDIDRNHNGKADQHRWLSTAGTRWGIDRNEDGTIDQWKAISAEEVTAEVIRAIRRRDAARFARVLLSVDDIKSLGLGAARRVQLTALVKAAPAAFAALVRSQKVITQGTKWADFGATRPGIVPLGTDGSTADLTVYENVVAVTDTAGKFHQVYIGTLVKVGQQWRVVDAPQIGADGTAATAGGGFFFQVSAPNTQVATAQPVTPPADEKTQKLLAQLEKLDQQTAAAATPEAQAKLVVSRADMLEQLAAAASDTINQANWLRQLADTISVAVQSGEMKDGVERLAKLVKTIGEQPEQRDLAAYVRFRQLAAEYGQSLQQPNADYEKIQTEWLKNLEGYVKRYPQGDDTAEAMLQLGFSQEHSGNESAAKDWYSQIADKFPKSTSAKKATGAVARLESVGKQLRLKGTTVTGSALDISAYRGKVVLIHYWATWSEPCRADLSVLKNIQAKYARDRFAIIGVSLDANKNDLRRYLTQNRLPWPHIYEEGGLDSRLANELGILTLPTMLLVDDRGRVINRNVHVGGLDGELKKLLR